MMRKAMNPQGARVNSPHYQIIRSSRRTDHTVGLPTN